MDATIKQVEYLLDGFLYFFGFLQNPAEEPAKETLNESPTQKIRSDIKKVNAVYRKEFNKLREEAMCIER